MTYVKTKMIDQTFVVKCLRCGAIHHTPPRMGLFTQDHPETGEWGAYTGQALTIALIHRCSETEVGTAVLIGYDLGREMKFGDDKTPMGGTR